MANKLKHLDEFKAVLSDYHLSARGQKALAEIQLVILVGPTAAGRNTIINALVKTGQYHFIVSDTTRQPRINNGVQEQNGVEYWFRSEEDMLADLRVGEFLEAAIIHNQQVSGISLRELESANKMHKVAVNEIEVVGMQNTIQAKPDTFAFFVAPPSFETWMQRLDNRGNMPAAEKHQRLQTAVMEFQTALDHDYYIYLINDEFNHSVERINQRVIKGVQDPTYQASSRAVIETLHQQTKAYLASVS
jgi:guanylate kinase